MADAAQTMKIQKIITGEIRLGERNLLLEDEGINITTVRNIILVFSFINVVGGWVGGCVVGTSKRIVVM
jgi:hypothetical protein